MGWVKEGRGGKIGTTVIAYTIKYLKNKYSIIKVISKPVFKNSIYLKSKLYLPTTVFITVVIVSQSSFYMCIISRENILLRMNVHQE